MNALLQTLSNFASLQLPRTLLRPELEFARANISAAIELQARVRPPRTRLGTRARRPRSAL